ncbi:transmembrane protein 79-like [Xyrauchen texanus]|uniref:transmembrane protein 79-like n=1 Tax=Xyrauchen texanus TaxID=154827 RepID=UPI0022429436|nr:transmembrane protein 79-like [Xyrauchen texanus]
MTELLVIKPERVDERKPLTTSENFQELQRSDGDHTEPRTLQWHEDRGPDHRSPEGQTSSQEQVSGMESSRELERGEHWMGMEEKKSDDERGDQDSGDGSLADDEKEDDDDEIGCDRVRAHWMPEKAGQLFTPNIMIVQPTCHQQDLNESSVMKEEIQMEKAPLYTQNFHMSQPKHFHPQWIEDIEKPKDSCCGEIVRVCVFITAAAVIFPLLTWGGYELLPFKIPLLDSTPFRLVYTLRCAFFATIPIVLGVLVQGASRLRFGTLKPLFVGTWEIRQVAVHSHYVRESLHLYLLYFMQLAVMATYIQQEMLKLVPLLTIIFVIGRLIYWVCVVYGSSVRALGFGLSFLPLLALLGANLYFIGSVGGAEVIFDVAPPTTPPPPKLRWWG